MASAGLFVQSGKKLDQKMEEEIRGRLSGKRFEIMLAADDVDESKKVANAAAVEKKIVQELLKQAPPLKHAQRLVFKPPVKALGDCKLMVETETQRPFPCQLLLEAPEKLRAADGKWVIASLYDKAKIDDVLNVRFCRAEIAYSLRHPDGAGMIKMAAPVMREIGRKTVGEVDDLLQTTLVALRKGIASKGSNAMSWKDAKKLVDTLNKDVQRVINTISDQGEAALGKLVGGTAPGATASCSVVAMFSKFEVLGSVYFPGGGAPSANEKSIKPLEKKVSKLRAMAEKLDAATAALVTEADGYCLAQRKAQAEVEGGRNENTRKQGKADATDVRVPAKDEVKALAEKMKARLEKPLGDLQAKITEVADLVEDQYKHADALAGLVTKVRKVNDKEKSDAPTSEDKKHHLVLKRELELFRKQLDLFEAELTESMKLCRAMEDQARPPACYVADGSKKIQDSANTLEQKRLVPIAQRMAQMCEKAVDLIEE